MDRRDALKKIAAGGAVAGGASLIVSQPAFAAFNASANPSVSAVSVPAANRVRVVVSFGTACGSGGSVQSSTTTYSVTCTPIPSGTSVTAFFDGSQPSFSSTTNFGQVALLGAFNADGGVTFQKDSGDFLSGEGVSVTLSSAVECVYAGGTGNASGSDSDSATKP